MAGASSDRDERAGAPVPPSVQTHGSSLVEKVLEYRFLGGVTAELLKRGTSFDVLRSDVDCHGHDIVIEAAGVVRHIQLKAMVAGGRRANVTVSTSLAARPSGCVVWMIYDPSSYEPTAYRWFGAVPGCPLPDLGDRLARHSKGNAQGLKAPRSLHRVVTARRFMAVPNVERLVNLMFGRSTGEYENALLRHLDRRTNASDAPSWLEDVRRGDFAALPETLTWDRSGELAHLIDGYELAEELGISDPIEFAERQLATANDTGRWEGDAVELWISLFLEHRRWRFSSPFEPDEDMVRLLDTLVGQLRQKLQIQMVGNGEDNE